MSTAEAVADIVETEIERAADGAAAAIEAAQEETERAEETAAALASAAMESERGQRISTLETELGECRERIATLESQGVETAGHLATIRMEMEMMKTQAIAPPIVVATVTENSPPSLLTPEKSEPVVTATVITPAVNHEQKDHTESVAAPARKRRVI